MEKIGEAIDILRRHIEQQNALVLFLTVEVAKRGDLLRDIQEQAVLPPRLLERVKEVLA